MTRLRSLVTDTSAKDNYVQAGQLSISACQDPLDLNLNGGHGYASQGILDVPLDQLNSSEVHTRPTRLLRRCDLLADRTLNTRSHQPI